jgi:hypothetical protein
VFWNSIISAAALAGIAVLPVAASAGSLLTFRLDNESGYALTDVYVSPSLEDKWGKDALGGKPLANGDTADIAVAGRDNICHYDIRFVGDDGSLLEDVAIDLCSIERYTLEP